MMDEKRRPPELDRAVRDLLLAERDLSRTYANWLSLPVPERDTRREDIERAEQRVDHAREAVIRWQDGR